jgi:uncharacterized protein YecE (DUF72 family)
LLEQERFVSLGNWLLFKKEMAEWHIGCSGFHYKHWKGTFYPEKLAQSKWFNFYCQHFQTLELNVTFYRFPRLENLQVWYENSPPDFRFAVKAPRAITHFKKFNGTEKMLSSFYDTVKTGLKEKCGCILFQMPPNYHYDALKLERILSSLDLSIPQVLEFRHESWWNEDVFSRLGEAHVSFCGMSHPELPATIIKNTGLVYFRFHGTEQLYASRYSKAELDAFAESVLADPAIKTGYVFFNNDINTSAVYNAKELDEVLTAKGT